MAYLAPPLNTKIGLKCCSFESDNYRQVNITNMNSSMYRHRSLVLPKMLDFNFYKSFPTEWQYLEALLSLVTLPNIDGAHTNKNWEISYF